VIDRVCGWSKCGRKLPSEFNWKRQYCNIKHRNAAYRERHPNEGHRRPGSKPSKSVPVSLKFKFDKTPCCSDVKRPRDYQECLTGINAARPCPFVGCRHHLALDVNPRSGKIKIIRPDVPVWEMEESCSLDVANRGPITLELTGQLLNVTRERVRQLEETTIEYFRRKMMTWGVSEDEDDE